MPLFASDIFVKIIDDYDDIPGKFRLKDKTSILFYSGKILKISMPELRKVFIAFCGELTIGSPRRLKEVFSTTGTPVASLNRLMSDVRVAEIMTSKIAYVRPEQTNEECMALVTEKRVRHLPVLENDRLIGLLSIGDLVKEAIAEQAELIRQLEQYIRGE